jgi:hypothetical protein
MPNPEFDRELDNMGFVAAPVTEQAPVQLGNPDFDKALDELGFAPVPETSVEEAPVEPARAVELGSAIIDKVAGVEGPFRAPSDAEIVDAQVRTAQTSAGLTAANNPRTTVRLGAPR